MLRRAASHIQEDVDAEQRPSVDNDSFELAAHFLDDDEDFMALRLDIQEDLRWELADTIQKATEGWINYQFKRGPYA